MKINQISFAAPGFRRYFMTERCIKMRGRCFAGRIMLAFALRRIGYSLLIVLGVVLLTFLLFNVAAGDPAAAVLGKNPEPAEVESLRRELGADLPLLYGRRCRTEAFRSGTFAANSPLPVGVVRRTLSRERMEYIFEPQFPSDDPLTVTATGLGNARIEIDNFDPESGLVRDNRLPVIVRITGENAVQQPVAVHFFRLQDSPLHTQFSRALGEICRFTPEFPYVRVLDFGRTLTTREPISKILRRGVGPSLGLMLPIFFGELFFGVLLALLATAFKDRLADRLLVLFSVAGMSVSYLVLIIFAQWFLGYYCNWFPVWGWGDWRYLALPVLVGVVSGLGGSVRFYRTVFVDELRREYLRTAAAKGCAPWTVYGRHLLRSAAIPIITRASAVLPFLFTGSLLLETFFGIPGLGFAGIDALNNSDLQLLKALVVVSALLFVALNLLADLAYAWADPRIRLE